MKIIFVSQPDSQIGPETDRVSETEGSVDFWSIIAEIKGAAAESSGRPRGETGSRLAGNNNDLEEFADPALSGAEQRPAESSQKSGPESGVEVSQRQQSGSERVREGLLFEGYRDVLAASKSEAAPAVTRVSAPDSDSVAPAALDNPVPISSSPVPTSSGNELWIVNFLDDHVVDQDPSGSSVEAKGKDPLENVPRAIGSESQFQDPSKTSVPRPESGRSEEAKVEWGAPPQAAQGRSRVDPARALSRGEVADARSNDEFSNLHSAALRVKNRTGTIESGPASIHSRPSESNAESVGSTAEGERRIPVHSSHGSKGKAGRTSVESLRMDYDVDSGSKRSGEAIRPGPDGKNESQDVARGHDERSKQIPLRVRSEVVPAASAKSSRVEASRINPGQEGASRSGTRTLSALSFPTESDSSGGNDRPASIESDTRRIVTQDVRRGSEIVGEAGRLNEKPGFVETPPLPGKDPSYKSTPASAMPSASLPNARYVAQEFRFESSSPNNGTGVSEEEDFRSTRGDEARNARSEKPLESEEGPEFVLERPKRDQRGPQSNESARRISAKFETEASEPIQQPKPSTQRQAQGMKELGRSVEQMPAQSRESKSPAASSVPGRIDGSVRQVQSVKGSPTQLISTPAPEMEFITRLAGRIRSMVANRQGLLRVQLEPADFGRMEIRAQQGVRGIVAQIILESETVRGFLENRLHILQQSLADQGLRFDKLQIIFQGDQATSSPGSGGQFQQSQSHSRESDPEQPGSSHDATSESSEAPEETSSDSRVPGGFHTIA